MIVIEDYATRLDEVKLIHTYSDEGFWLIRNDGVRYADAIDIEDSGYTYTEAEDYVEPPEEVSAEEALAELLEVLE